MNTQLVFTGGFFPTLLRTTITLELCLWWFTSEPGLITLRRRVNLPRRDFNAINNILYYTYTHIHLTATGHSVLQFNVKVYLSIKPTHNNSPRKLKMKVRYVQLYYYYHEDFAVKYSFLILYTLLLELHTAIP